MKMMRRVLSVFSFVVVLPRFCRAVEITPTQQVINMMVEMHERGEKMMNEEQKVYFRYQEWVEDETRKLGFAIVDGERKIEELIAYITKTDSDVNKLRQQISALESEIGTHEKEKEDAAKMREEQHAAYIGLSTDYSESVDALRRAIQVLSSQDYDRAQAELLLQRMSATVPGMSRVLAAFLQEKNHGSLRGDGAPAVAAYEFQSGGIVALLNSLFSKFKSELADVEDAESSQAHEFSLLELHVTNVISKAKSDRDERAVTKGKFEASSARAKGELADTRVAKAADEKLKAEMEATFAAKSATYAENQRVRADEIKALSEAIEIISSPAVSASYAKHINLAQVSLLQLGVGSQSSTKVKQAVALLSQRAHKLHSMELQDLASRATDNPFSKVIGMIENLIAKLKAMASAEAEHKAWCDEQLNANKHRRNKKTAQVNKLVAEIQGHEANIADMGKSIDQLVAEQAALAKQMTEASQFRDAEKAQNLAAIADAKAGFAAVAKALEILKEFYSSHASSLLQQVPEMAEYKGLQDKNKGVIGMLEVIQTDFARLQAETEAAESQAAAEYKTFMKVSTTSKKDKHEEEFQLSLDKDQTEYENSNSKEDLTATQEELARANRYFEYLQPNCLEVHVSWEERVAKRKEEVAALKEAYAILDLKASD